MATIFSNKNHGGYSHAAMHELVAYVLREMLRLWESSCRLLEKKDDRVLQQGTEYLEGMVKKLNTVVTADSHCRLSS